MSSSSCLGKSVKLSNGVEIPSVAFGLAFGNWTGQKDVFQGFLPEQAWPAIQLALNAGFRHFDGAHAYSTEKHLGISLAEKFQKSLLKREDIFITTKLCHPAGAPHIFISHLRTWNPRDVPSIKQRVLDDFARTLEDLGVGYVDLLLMHWPGAFNEKDKAFAHSARMSMWKVFESLYEKGVVRAIGVSNFTQQHLTELMAEAKIMPMVNQIELHPYCQDEQLVSFCNSKGIVIEAYAPFASGAFGMLKDPVLLEIAKETGKTVGQVVLRWHLQLGHVVLPKTSSSERAKENLSIFDFELNTSQMEKIKNLHPKGQAPKRTCPDPNAIL